MIANDAPGGIYGTVDRFREAGMAVGYQFEVLNCRTNGQETRLTVTNNGIAPIYRDAYFALADVQSETSLRGLLPNETMEIVLPKGFGEGDQLRIVSPYILPTQQIEYCVKTLTK
jgi:hypothetical protein